MSTDIRQRIAYLPRTIQGLVLLQLGSSSIEQLERRSFTAASRTLQWAAQRLSQGESLGGADLFRILDVIIRVHDYQWDVIENPELVKGLAPPLADAGDRGSGPPASAPPY